MDGCKIGIAIGWPLFRGFPKKAGLVPRDCCHPDLVADGLTGILGQIQDQADDWLGFSLLSKVFAMGRDSCCSPIERLHQLTLFLFLLSLKAFLLFFIFI